MNTICIKIADITTLSTDAIVNAANDGLRMGGGVCGAIFKAAGPNELKKECSRYNGCPTGSAVITSGCRLKAKYVIHAVGPIWHGGSHNEADLLLSCYAKSLQLAKENDCHSIAFPLISSGIYGYPKMEAWRMGLMACITFFSRYPGCQMKVTFAVLDKESKNLGIAILENICKQSLVDGIDIWSIFRIDDETYEETSKKNYLPKMNKPFGENPDQQADTVTEKKWDKMNNAELVDIFKDTISLAKNDPYLQIETVKMQAKTRLYLSDYFCTLKPLKGNGDNIEVVGISTFMAAKVYRKDGKVAVLNFANAVHPGGGVTHGSLAQEECLCRSSNLYLGLDVPYLRKHYYDFNKNDKHGGAMGSDSVIYSPGVTIFKNDKVAAELLPRGEWYETDVITCAAPRFYHPDKIIEHKLSKLHMNRGKNILEVAIANDVDVIVLGAFGCGAFHNTPQTVAEAYRELLVDQGYAKHFKKVVFAIIGDQNDKFGNYDVFKRVFQ